MSFLRKPKIAFQKSDVAFKVDVAPNPASKPSPAKAAAQAEVISKIRKQAFDLMRENPAVKDGNTYRSSQLYAPHVSVQDLSAAMKDYDLVLKVSGKDSCLQVTSEHLDSAAEAGSIQLAFPLEQGSLTMGLQKVGGSHYIQKLDHTTPSAS